MGLLERRLELAFPGCEAGDSFRLLAKHNSFRTIAKLLRLGRAYVQQKAKIYGIERTLGNTYEGLIEALDQYPPNGKGPVQKLNILRATCNGWKEVAAILGVDYNILRSYRTNHKMVKPNYRYVKTGDWRRRFYGEDYRCDEVTGNKRPFTGHGRRTTE